LKALIVTADDVGLHRGMTEGAIQACRRGVVTACSLVANGAAFEHAVEQLRDVPQIEVGVHLTLVEERPLASKVDSLVGSNDLLHENFVAFVPRYYARMIDIDEVERELRMQVERILGTGLRVTHVNGHQHLHLLPRLFELALRLADEYSIRYIRTVDDRGNGGGWGRKLAIRRLSAMGRSARKETRKCGLATNDATLGVAAAGHLITAEQLIALLDAAGDGVTELVTHPGLGDVELRSAYDWEYEWDAETRALCSPQLRQAISDRGFALVAPSAVS
jgi:predicted glycoside hydrolase/deacetylase ChbG (UPF0249 family)